MSQSSNDRLQFSINESVWLRDDVPAEEILSMALDPDITVEETWNDVTIKGFLRLTGEYKPAELAEETIHTAEQKPAPFRTIEEITDTGNGTDLLEHHFPIDITIPADRVPNLENVFVVVDSFDYELSEHRHIQLQADIAITGLTNDKAAKRSEKPQAKPAAEKPTTAAKEKKPKAKSSGPAKKAAEKPMAESTKEKTQLKESPSHDTQDAQPGAAKKANKNSKPAAKKEANKEKAEKNTLPEKEKKGKKAGKAAHLLPKSRENAQSHAADAEAFAPGDREIMADTDPDEAEADFQYDAIRKPDDDTEEKDGTPAVAFNRPSERSEEPVSQPLPVMPPEQADTVPEMEEQESGDQENKVPNAASLYLTKVLAGDEEEQKTRLKICIVQSGDSLETISERYHVPVTSLLRKNDLTSSEIEPGELLYIPKSAKASGDAQ